MSRTINEPIQTLESSLTDINNSLKAKNIEGWATQSQSSK